MREPRDRLTDRQLSVLRVLLVAPLMGACFAIAIVYFLDISVEVSETAANIVRIGGIALVAGLLFLRFVIGRAIRARLREQRDVSVDRFHEAYRGGMLITAVATEVGVFAILAPYVVTGELIFIGIACVLPVTALLHIPSQVAFQNWCAAIREGSRG